MKTYHKISNRLDSKGNPYFEIEETKTETKTDKALYTIESLEAEIATYEALLTKKRDELKELNKLL